MTFFNERLVEAMLSRNYVCNVCGSRMGFEDEWEDNLICTQCGHEVDLDHYGIESDEDYDALYPTRDEILDMDEDDESYDEVCEELEN